MKFEDDLATMFDTEAFAQEATIVLPADVAGRVLVGLFDNPSATVDVAAGIGSSAPSFTLPDVSIPASMLAALESGDVGAVKLSIGGKTYVATTHDPDGNGVTSMRLRA
jgi:hypothetical protein